MTDDSGVVAHVLYNCELGGLQSLLAACIRRTGSIGVRHIVFCLAEADQGAASALGDVELISLQRTARGACYSHRKLFLELRRTRPALLHTYNIGTLEYVLTGALARVPRRIHSEHGRGMHERFGNNKKYNLLRYALAPLIERYVTVSRDLSNWLTDTVSIPKHKVCLINNGVDTELFRPLEARDPDMPFTIGTVGRLDTIKAQADLIDAFILLRHRYRDSPLRLRLVLVGDGPLYPVLAEKIAAAGIADSVWMPGARRDIAEIMRSLSVFVLPSLSEASPVTILEAMASGTPVVATGVGGVPDLIGANLRGTLVRPSDTAALADAIGLYMCNPSLRRHHAEAARRFVIEHFNIDTTLAAYGALYASPSLTCVAT